MSSSSARAPALTTNSAISKTRRRTFPPMRLPRPASARTAPRSYSLHAAGRAEIDVMGGDMLAVEHGPDRRRAGCAVLPDNVGRSGRVIVAGRDHIGAGHHTEIDFRRFDPAGHLPFPHVAGGVVAPKQIGGVVAVEIARSEIGPGP